MENKLKEIQMIENNILIELVKFLDNNNINYFLDYGTLIGAIRHKGFIPWDDDIDISMTRKEYNKFIKAAIENNNHINEYLTITAPELHNSTFTFGKVFDIRYKVKEKNDDFDEEFVWVDIFPYDDITDDIKKEKKRFEKIKTIRKLIFFKKIKLKNLYKISKNKFKFVIEAIIKLVLFFIPYNFLVNKSLRIAQKENFNCSKVHQFVHALRLFPGESKNDMENLVYVEFEGNMYKTLHTYDKHLRNIYGDYMQLPPEDKRVSHLENFWKV